MRRHNYSDWPEHNHGAGAGWTLFVRESTHTNMPCKLAELRIPLSWMSLCASGLLVVPFPA